MPSSLSTQANRLQEVLTFGPDDVAFLFIPEKLHAAALEFFEGHLRENTGPAYLCPYVDPTWDMPRIQTALAHVFAPPAPVAPLPIDDACAYCGGPTIDGLFMHCGKLTP